MARENDPCGPAEPWGFACLWSKVWLLQPCVQRRLEQCYGAFVSIFCDVRSVEIGQERIVSPRLPALLSLSFASALRPLASVRVALEASTQPLRPAGGPMDRCDRGGSASVVGYLPGAGRQSVPVSHGSPVLAHGSP